MLGSTLRQEQIFKFREDVHIFLQEVRASTPRTISYRQAEASLKTIRDIVLTYGIPIPFGEEVEDQIRDLSKSRWRAEELRDGKQRIFAAFIEVMIRSVGHYSILIRDIYSCCKTADARTLSLLDQVVTEYTIRSPDFRSSCVFSGCFNPATDLVKPVRNQVQNEMEATFLLWNAHSKVSEKPHEMHNRFCQAMARLVVKPTEDDFVGLRLKQENRQPPKRARPDPYALGEDDDEEEEVDDATYFLMSGGKNLMLLGGKGPMLFSSPPAKIEDQ
jgi:hypothetical protein